MAAHNVPDIPGFYYDQEKRRYFKITGQSNAPTSLKYNKGEINKKKLAEEERKVQQRIDSLRKDNALRLSQKLLNPLNRAFENRLQVVLSSKQVLKSTGEGFISGYRICNLDRGKLDYQYNRSDNLWSYSEGTSGQLHGRLCPFVTQSLADDSVVTVAESGHIIQLSTKGHYTFLYLEENSLPEVKYSVIKLITNLTPDCYYYLHRKSLNSNMHEFLQLSIIHGNIDDIRLMSMDFGTSEIFDSIILENGIACVAMHNGIQLIGERVVGSELDIRLDDKVNTDVLCLTRYVITYYDIPCNEIWFGCRNGSIYQALHNCFLGFTTNTLFCSFNGSIINLVPLGSNLLLASIAGNEDNLRILDTKHAGRSKNPTMIILKTKFKNVTRDTELLKVVNNGKYILYGNTRANDGIGGFEIFSIDPDNNLVQDTDNASKAVVYYPIMDMNKCFPEGSLSHMRGILGVDIRFCKAKELRRYTANSSEEFSFKDSDSEHYHRGEFRLSMLTNDDDASGIALRCVNLV